MDFLNPYATKAVRPALHHTETPSPKDALGVTGVGEAGVTPVSAVVANAVADALDRQIDYAPLSPVDRYALVDGRR